jgi:hypothetical protein
MARGGGYQASQKARGVRLSDCGTWHSNSPRKPRRSGALGQPLNSYTAAAFYESFSMEVVLKLARKIEFIYTPVHGSWLNIIEIEVSVLVRHCLKRWLPDIATLSREAKAWTAQRNWAGASVEWSFTTEDARIKFRSLYLSVRKSNRGLVLRLFHPLGDEQTSHRPFGTCALASASSRVCVL